MPAPIEGVGILEHRFERRVAAHRPGGLGEAGVSKAGTLLKWNAPVASVSVKAMGRVDWSGSPSAIWNWPLMPAGRSIFPLTE